MYKDIYDKEPTHSYEGREVPPSTLQATDPGEPVFQFKSKGWKKNPLSLLEGRQEEFFFFFFLLGGGSAFFVLFRPLADEMWTFSAHVNVHLIQNKVWPNICRLPPPPSQDDI